MLRFSLRTAGGDSLRPSELAAHVQARPAPSAVLYTGASMTALEATSAPTTTRGLVAAARVLSRCSRSLRRGRDPAGHATVGEHRARARPQRPRSHALRGRDPEPTLPPVSLYRPNPRLAL